MVIEVTMFRSYRQEWKNSSLREYSDGLGSMCKPQRNWNWKAAAWGIPKDFITYTLDLMKDPHRKIWVYLDITAYSFLLTGWRYPLYSNSIASFSQTRSLCHLSLWKDLFNNILSNNGSIFYCKTQPIILQIIWRMRIFSVLTCVVFRIDRPYWRWIQRSFRNKDGLEILNIRSVWNILNALRSNEIMFDDCSAIILTIFPDDYDLLDDVIMKNQQAIEMTELLAFA